MAEIKRNPLDFMIDGVDYIAFDDDHTHMDLIRYLLLDLTPEEIYAFAKAA